MHVKSKLFRTKMGEKWEQRVKKSKKWGKKGAGCKENRALLDFSCIFRVAVLLEFELKFDSLSNATSFSALALILKEL